MKFKKKVPHIIFDGIIDEEIADENGVYSPENMICIRNNEGGDFANLDAANGFKDLNRDATNFDCERKRIPAMGSLNK